MSCDKIVDILLTRVLAYGWDFRRGEHVFVYGLFLAMALPSLWSCSWVGEDCRVDVFIFGMGSRLGSSPFVIYMRSVMIYLLLFVL